VLKTLRLPPGRDAVRIMKEVLMADRQALLRGAVIDGLDLS
jgi:hypothetical protein